MPSTGLSRAGRAGRIALVALAIAGATSAFASPAPVRSLLEERHRNVIVQDWDSSCGASALATILNFHLGDRISERSVALGMLRRTDPDRVRGRGGFSLLDMKRFAVQRGYTAEGYGGLTRGQLLRLAPVIVPMNRHGNGHFVVFRGAIGGQAVLADPAFGNRTLPFTEFERQWQGRVAFSITPRSGRGVNGLAVRESDLLRVGDDAARAASDEKLPKPLQDWELERLQFGARQGDTDSTAISAAASEWNGTARESAAGPQTPLRRGRTASPPPASAPGSTSTNATSAPTGISSTSVGTSLVQASAPPVRISVGSTTIAPPSLPPLPPISVSIPPISATVPPITSNLPPLPRIPGR